MHGFPQNDEKAPEDGSSNAPKELSHPPKKRPRNDVKILFD